MFLDGGDRRGDIFRPGRGFQLVPLGFGRDELGFVNAQLRLQFAIIDAEQTAPPFAMRSPFLTYSSVTTPGTLTPIGIFSRRASTKPAPAIEWIELGRTGGGTGARRR